MTKLVRTKIDKFDIKDAVTISEVKKNAESSDVEKTKKIINFKNIEYIFNYDRMAVNEEKYKKLKNGMTVLFKKNKFKKIEKITENKRYKIYLKNKTDEKSEFKGIAKVMKIGTDMIYIKREKYFL